MKNRFLLLIILLKCGSFCFGQTNERIVHRYFNNFEDSTLNAGWMNPNTIASDNDPAKNHFSRTDEIKQYSSGIEISIPEDLRRKNFRITVNGLIRITNPEAKSQLVISISRGDSAIFWKGDYLPDSSGKTNEWNAFRIAVVIPRNIPTDSKAKIFLWNPSGKYITDIDDLDINFTEVKFPSFLPN